MGCRRCNDNLEMAQPAKEPTVSYPTPLVVYGILALLVLYTLYFAASLVLPVYLAFLMSLALSPLVRVLRRLRIPRAAGAAIVLAAFLTVGGYVGVALSEPAAEWMAKAPSSFEQIERRLRVVKRPLEQVSEATQGVEDITDVDGKNPPIVQLRGSTLAETLFSGTRTLLAQAFSILVLLYFLLASSDDLFHKLAATLPGTRTKPAAADMVRLVESEISRYLLTVCLINTGLAIVVAGAMYLLEMPSALLWGVVGGTLNFIPFIGAICTTGILAVASLLTFDSLAQAALPPLVFACITTFEGFFVTPTLVGRRLTLSPIAILLALFVWSWIWGIAGALIAVPTLAILKIVADRSERLSPIATLIAP
jgi:predicted PurR-regulated permease PerM